MNQYSPQPEVGDYCLTVLEPFACALVEGPKSIENRTWPAPKAVIGNRLFIHAGASMAMLKDPDVKAFIQRHWPRGLNRPYAFRQIVGSGILTASVRIGDDLAHDPWAHGPFCWCLDDLRPVSPDASLIIRGRQGVFRLTADDLGNPTPTLFG